MRRNDGSCTLFRRFSLEAIDALKDGCFVENLQATDSFSRMSNIIVTDQRQYTVLTGHIKVTYSIWCVLSHRQI